MTKTQTKLIAEAAKRGGSYSIETGVGRGRKGGRISYGSREMAALTALVASGKARITHRESDTEWTGNGHSVHGSVIAYTLTPTDEQFSAALGPCGK